MPITGMDDLSSSDWSLLTQFKCQQYKAKKRHIVRGLEKKSTLCGSGVPDQSINGEYVTARGINHPNGPCIFDYATFVTCKNCVMYCMRAIHLSMVRDNQPFALNSIEEMRLYFDFLEERGDQRMMRLVRIHLALITFRSLDLPQGYPNVKHGWRSFSLTK